MTLLTKSLYVVMLSVAMIACALISLPGAVAPSIAMLFGGAP